MSYEDQSIIYAERDLSCPKKPVTAKLVDMTLAVVTTPIEDASLVIGNGIMSVADPTIQVSCLDCPGYGCQVEMHGLQGDVNGIIQTFNTAQLVPAEGRPIGKLIGPRHPLHSLGSTEISEPPKIVALKPVQPMLSESVTEADFAAAHGAMDHLTSEQQHNLGLVYPIIVQELSNGVPRTVVFQHASSQQPGAVEAMELFFGITIDQSL